MTLSPALIRPLQRCTLNSIRQLGHHAGPPPERWRAITLLEQRCQHPRPRFYASKKEKVVTKSVAIEHPITRPVSRTRTGRKWSKEQDDLLLALRKTNKTWDYIGMATGRSSSACSDRYYTAVDPALREWTPAMFVKLEQMVDQGARWSDISETLNSNVITCQHQWRMLGRGKYRVNSTMAMVQALDWTSGEVNSFWTAWLQHEGMDWEAISESVASKSAAQCRDSFKSLTVNALKDAPGWLRIEASKYVVTTTRNARSYQHPPKSKPSSEHETTQWTAAEHEELLKAVEEHGLFSGWDNIRKLVKPGLSEDEVEAEYYKLSGVALDSHSEIDEDRYTKPKALDGEWTADQAKILNTVLMRYSTLPVWTAEAAKRGISASDNDSETYLKLLHDNPGSHGEDADGEDASSWSPSVWNQERISRLKRLVKQQQQQEVTSGQPINWSWIAEHIGPGFDSGACITQWQSLPDESKLKMDSSKFWDENDVDLLKQGIVTFGKSWTLIHQNYLPRRTTESIRRKVSNVRRKKEELTRDVEKWANHLKVSNPGLNVDDYVYQTIKNDPFYLMGKELDEAYAQHKNGAQLRSKSSQVEDVVVSQDSYSPEPHQASESWESALGNTSPSSSLSTPQESEDAVVDKAPSLSPSPLSSLPPPPPRRGRGRPRRMI